MISRVNPKLIRQLEIYGAQDVQNCYHCGSCSAVCNHADDTFVFPRKAMRLLQMGLEKRIESSLDPWLCYYCGQCSTQCPRGAEPGETMMSLRRWLTARYDFSGVSRLFYRSWRAELVALLLVAVLTAVGFLGFGLTHGDIHHYDGPQAFLPSASVHVFDWALATVLATLLLVNVVRMWWFTTGRNVRIRPKLPSYLKALWLLPLEFVTQKEYARCETRQPWVVHLILMLSYVSMLVLIMFFLALVQAGPEIRWQVHAVGYVASAGLLFGVIHAVVGRIRKREPHVAHSHESDWIFLVMLLVVTATGITQHALHRVGMETAANITYVVHLSLVVPMLLLEVPFGKWSHLAYRPVASFLAAVHRDTLARQRRAEQAAAGERLAAA
jgi:quinone-modifying oxidoreductase, subunit QmoC